MPIRALPFDIITAAHVHDLQSRGVREDRTLDFKRELRLREKNDHSELLKDIVAFANAGGGTLLYGVEEGTGDSEGIIVGTPGLQLEPDSTHRPHRQSPARWRR